MNYNTYIIAEIGINHEGSISRCIEMIKAAKECGVSAVKLQTLNPDLNYAKDTLSYKLFKSSILTQDETEKAFKYAKKIGLDVFTTVGDMYTAKWVRKLKPDAWKVSSSMLTHIPLIQHLAGLKEHIFVSTGLALENEINSIVNLFRKKKKYNFSLLHCTSIYPANLIDLNLHKIAFYKKKFKVRVGYSDHSIGSFASSLAIASGAEIIEKHFTFDQKRKSYDHKISLNYKQMNNFVNKMRKVEKIFSNNTKKLKDLIKSNRKKFYRVIVVNKNLKKGSKLSKYNTAIKRVIDNTDGLFPDMYNTILNKKLNRDLKKDEKIKLENIY